MRAGRMWISVVIVGVSLAACGGRSNVVGPSEPETVPSAEAFTDTVPSLAFTARDYTIFTSGSLDVTLTWANAGSDLDLYVTTDACASLNDPCAVLAKSESASGNRERIGVPVRSGERYRVWVVNYSARAETYTLEALVR
jgi:hypothetical protein